LPTAAVLKLATVLVLARTASIDRGVSASAREAGVSRNTIYANHRSIIKELNSNHPVTTRQRPASKHKIAELGVMIEQLKL
jgi:hypothetical protein